MRHKANAPTDLQEDVEHIHVCLLHLIKQDDAVRLVADRHFFFIVGLPVISELPGEHFAIIAVSHKQGEARGLVLIFFRGVAFPHSV